MGRKDQILLIEIESSDQLAIAQKLKSHGGFLKMAAVNSVDEARQELTTRAFDLVIFNFDLDHRPGLEILQAYPHVPLIFASNCADERLAMEVIRHGVYDFLIKDELQQYLMLLPLTIQRTIELHQSRQKLEASESRYEELFEGTTNLIQCVDENGSFQYVNKAWRETLGYDDSEIYGMNLFDVIHPDDHVHCMTIMEKLLRCGTAKTIETRLLCKGGTQFVYVRGGTSMRRKPDGTCLTQSIFHDATIEISAEQQLKVANEDLELKVVERTTELAKSNANLRNEVEEKVLREQQLTRINDELNTFIYKCSHDIRGPLTSVLGLVELVKIDLAESVNPSYFEMMEERITHLDVILKELIYLTRFRSGELENERIDLDALLNQVLQGIGHLPQFEEVSIVRKIEATDLAFYADKSVLKTILKNLIINGIKYRDLSRKKAQLLVACEMKESTMKMTISDNGIGISNEFQNNVFDMFFRGTNQSKGSGLGLYIVQKAVHKMDGTIDLESEEGVGTTFTIHLPNKVPEWSEKQELV